MPFKQARDYLYTVGMHSGRTRALNAFYETTKNFIERVYGKNEFLKLHTLDWFQVLTVLRNSASHADNYKKGNYFPNHSNIPQYPASLSWGTLTMTNKQRDPIRYNDKEVMELLKHALEFFETNYTG